MEVRTAASPRDVKHNRQIERGIFNSEFVPGRQDQSGLQPH
jgi:hypothetical protein